jgi:hypothetical protein
VKSNCPLLPSPAGKVYVTVPDEFDFKPVYPELLE